VTWSAKDGSLDFTTLRQAYASGTLTPRDVVSAVYDRIESRGEDHVWIHRVPRDEALTACDRVMRSLPRQTPLWGLPCAIKDNIDVPGLPSTSAFPPSRKIAKTTGPAVQRLLDAGAIVIGKTNMDQLAIGLVGVRSPYGTPRNVFDARYIPGGSSSGSAVAVGAGLVSFALGNDAAGSGRVPAAFANIVGVKPTPGLVSNSAVVGGGTARTLETISVLSLTVADGMEVLRLMAGYDPEDLFSKREADSCDLSFAPAAAPFRFGIPAPEHLDFCGDAEAGRLFDEAVRRLESLGGKRVEIDFTPFATAQRLLYEGPFLAERNCVIDAFVGPDRDSLHPVTRSILATSDKWTAVDTFAAIHRLAELKRQARRLFKTMDVLVVPTTPTIFTIAQIEADPIALNARLGAYTNYANLMELCGVAVPSGFRNDGLALGITIIAPPFQEARAASIAAAFHQSINLALGATNARLPAVDSFSPAERSVGPKRASAV
jgi:allophanate hydrolase